MFHYYEDNMEYEYNENYEDDAYWGAAFQGMMKDMQRFSKNARSL